MTYALRSFAVITVLALLPEPTAADSGRAAERAGQRAEPNALQQWFLQMIRDRRLAAWERQQRRARAQWDWDVDEFNWDRDTDAGARDAYPPR